MQERHVACRNIMQFDREFIAQISDGDLEFESDLVSSFSASSNLSLQVIDDAIARQDLATASRELHTLKGSARSVGAGKVGDIAFTLEQNLKHSIVDESLLNRLKEVLAEVRAEVQDWPTAA